MLIVTKKTQTLRHIKSVSIIHISWHKAQVEIQFRRYLNYCFVARVLLLLFVPITYVVSMCWIMWDDLRNNEPTTAVKLVGFTCIFLIFSITITLVIHHVLHRWVSTTLNSLTERQVAIQTQLRDLAQRE